MYDFIEDPNSGKKYGTNTREGQKILGEYVNLIGGYKEKNDDKSEGTSYADSFRTSLSSFGTYVTDKGKQARKEVDENIIARKIRDYDTAFKEKKPKLLQYYVNQLDKYDDKEYQDKVIRDACQTAFYLINNLGNMNVKSKKGIDYKCSSNLDKKEIELKKQLHEIEIEKKAINTLK